MSSSNCNTSYALSNLSQPKSDQSMSSSKLKQLPKSKHSASMRSSNRSKSNSPLSDSNKNDSSANLKISEATEIILDNSKECGNFGGMSKDLSSIAKIDCDTESEITIFKREKEYESMNESIAKHFLISEIIVDYNEFSEMDKIAKIAELNCAYSKMMEILKDDQAKLNDFKAYIAYRFDDRLDCIQIQLNYFFNDLNTKMIWISNYESSSFSSIHDSYSFDQIYDCYSEVGDLYWLYINSPVCKLCRSFRAKTKESSKIYAEYSEYMITSKFIKNDLSYERLKSELIIATKNELSVVIDKLRIENNSLQSKLDNMTQERDEFKLQYEHKAKNYEELEKQFINLKIQYRCDLKEFNLKIAEYEAMFKEVEQKNKSLTLKNDDLQSKELELINQINTANQFINTIKKVTIEPNSEFSQIRESINDKLKSQEILEESNKSVKCIKNYLSDLIRKQKQCKIDLKHENENVVTSENKLFYSSETAILQKENDIKNNQVCLDNKFEEEKTQRFKASISKNLSNQELTSNITNLILIKPALSHLAQSNQHPIATFPASVSSEILKTNLFSEPDQL